MVPGSCCTKQPESSCWDSCNEVCGGYEGDLQGEADRRGDPSNQGKWPAPTRHNPIFIQQDNAKSHRVNDHQDLLEACSSDGFNIEVINQPPNSPDTNMLDLGFSRQSSPCRTALEPGLSTTCLLYTSPSPRDS